MYVIELESNSRGNFHAAEEKSFFRYFSQDYSFWKRARLEWREADRESEVVAAI